MTFRHGKDLPFPTMVRIQRLIAQAKLDPETERTLFKEAKKSYLGLERNLRKKIRRKKKRVRER